MRRIQVCQRSAVAIFTLLLLAAPLAAEDISQQWRVRLYPDDFFAAVDHLERAGADIAGRNLGEGTIDLIILDNELSDLWQLGDVEMIARSRPFGEISRERLAAGIDMPEEQYKTYAEVLALMDTLQANFPAIAKKVNLTQMFGLPQTWEGRDLFGMKISDNVGQDEDELTILFDSLHHARELNTIEMSLDLMITLTELYGAHPRATEIVDDFEIWVVPVVNPDGLEYVWSTNSNWRKNRRDNLDGTFGVDPNRNYPFQWGVCGNNSGNTGSQVYRGPAPLSEPEAQTMVALGELIRPVVYISYHAFGQEVLPPYVCANLAESPTVTMILDAYRQRMNYGWRFASSSGESFEWYYNQASSVGYLTEVGTGFQPPFSQTRAEVRRVRPGWIRLFELLSAGPLLSGVVTDSQTGAAIEADISSNLVNFTEGERRACETGFGRYGWFLPLGEQTMTFSAPGYSSKMVGTSVAAGGTTLDVELDPLP